MSSFNPAATLVSGLPKQAAAPSASLPQQSHLSLESLQAEHLVSVLRSAGRKDRHISSSILTCTPSVHILTCGHSLRYQDGRVTPCTLACHEQCSSIESCSELGRSRNQVSGTISDEDVEMTDLFSGTDLARRIKDVEEYPVCPDCWLEQCLVRWYYFAEESKLSVSTAAFDTMEFVPNFLSVYMYPQIVEVSRKIDGVIHVWSGPWSIAAIFYEDSGMMAVIGDRLVNKGDEIPLARIPTQPSFVTIIRGPEENIQEIKLVPINKVRSNKKVTFWETPGVRNFFIDAPPRSLNGIAQQQGT